MTPRGRIDGLGWVKQGEDENLENALNALAYPDSDAALLNHQVCLGCIRVPILCLVLPLNADTSWLSAGGHLYFAAVLTADLRKCSGHCWDSPLVRPVLSPHVTTMLFKEDTRHLKRPLLCRVVHW